VRDEEWLITLAARGYANAQIVQQLFIRVLSGLVGVRRWPRLAKIVA
jgi:hypothetical protein